MEPKQYSELYNNVLEILGDRRPNPVILEYALRNFAKLVGAWESKADFEGVCGDWRVIIRQMVAYIDRMKLKRRD